MLSKKERKNIRFAVDQIYNLARAHNESRSNDNLAILPDRSYGEGGVVTAMNDLGQLISKITKREEAS